MKKLALLILFSVSIVSFVNAQSNALGIRFNAGDGTGIEASFQRFLGDANRLEIGLGLDLDNAFRVAAVYQWVWDLSLLADGFNWYAGVGGGLLLNDRGVDIGALGNLGIEYNFKIPLQLSFDIRPGFYFGSGSGLGFGGAALGVRYRF